MSITLDHHAKAQPWRARALMVAGMFLFSLMSALLKYTSGFAPISQQLLFSYGLCLLPLLAIAPWRPAMITISRPRWGWAFWRCLFGFVSACCAYYAYRHLPLADAVAISYAGPIFAALLATLWFREQASPLYWVALIIGFVGVVLIANPGGAGRDVLAILCALASAVMYGFVLVSLRFLTKTENPESLVFYFALFSTLCCLVAAPLVWQTPHGFWQWAPLVVTGLIMLGGQIAMTKATQLAPTTVVVPLSYSAIIFSALWGFLFWHETLSWLTIIGTALVLLANLTIIYLTSQPLIGAAGGSGK